MHVDEQEARLYPFWYNTIVARLTCMKAKNATERTLRVVQITTQYSVFLWLSLCFVVDLQSLPKREHFDCGLYDYHSYKCVATAASNKEYKRPACFRIDYATTVLTKRPKIVTHTR